MQVAAGDVDNSSRGLECEQRANCPQRMLVVSLQLAVSKVRGQMSVLTFILKYRSPRLLELLEVKSKAKLIQFSYKKVFGYFD